MKHGGIHLRPSYRVVPHCNQVARGQTTTGFQTAGMLILLLGRHLVLSELANARADFQINPPLCLLIAQYALILNFVPVDSNSAYHIQSLDVGIDTEPDDRSS
jgi:hypothetical protein